MVYFRNDTHAFFQIRAEGELIAWERITGHRTEIWAVAPLTQSTEVDSMRRAGLQLVIVAECKRACAFISRLAEFETGDGSNIVFAESLVVVQLTTCSPVIAGSLVGLEKTSRFGGHVFHIPFSVEVCECIEDSARGMTFLGCMVFLDVGLGLVDKLGVGGQSGNDTEKKVGVITHVLAAVVLCVLIHFVHRTGSKILKTRFESGIITA